MSLLLFSRAVSSLAETTEDLASKCQGTSGQGCYWPGAGLRLHYIWGKDLRQIVVALNISISILSISYSSICYSKELQMSGESFGVIKREIELLKDGDTGKKKAAPRPQQTERINNTAFHILESGSKASRSRYESTEASSHTLVDHDMERVTRLCKMCQRTDKTPTAPPMIPV